MHKGTARIMSMIALLVIYTEAKHRIGCQTIFYIFITSLEKLRCIDVRLFIPIIGLCPIPCIQSRGLLDNLKFGSFNNYFFNELIHSVHLLHVVILYVFYINKNRSQSVFATIRFFRHSLVKVR